MNIQRLKFAYARGARMQYQWPKNRWNLIVGEPSWNAGNKWRIHPDDAHLGYGPVSSAFRDMALFTDCADLDYMTEQFMDMAGTNSALPWEKGDDWDGDDLTIDFFRLFYAEFLADEGL